MSGDGFRRSRNWFCKSIFDKWSTLVSPSVGCSPPSPCNSSPSQLTSDLHRSSCGTLQPGHPHLSTQMCTAPTAVPWQPSWLLASELCHQSEGAELLTAPSRGKKRCSGGRSCCQSGEKFSWLRVQNNCKLKTWSPSGLICSGSLEIKSMCLYLAEKQRQQGLHPLGAVCLQNPCVQLRLSCQRLVIYRAAVMIFHIQHQRFMAPKA